VPFQNSLACRIFANKKSELIAACIFMHRSHHAAGNIFKYYQSMSIHCDEIKYKFTAVTLVILEAKSG
jgi:hypothetical protein